MKGAVESLSALVGAATLTLVTAAGATAPSTSLPPPAHTLTVSGTGVSVFPGFAPDIERYAVTTTPATGGTVTVRATTSDPAGQILVNGRADSDGIAQVTGLTGGDEISVIIRDTGGTAVHSLVYLPAEFPTLEVVTKEAGITPGYVGLTLTGWGQKSTPAFEAAVDTNGVPVYVLSTDSASMDLKRAANGSFTVSRPATNPGRTGHKVVELDARFRTVAEHETVGLEDTDSHDSILRPDGSRLLLAYEPNDVTGMIDSVVQEISPTGAVVFTWNSGDVPGEDLVAETLYPTGWKDYAHANSLWETSDGHLLVSFRHLSTVLKIDWRTDDGDGRGKILWKLGGRDSDFSFVDDPYPGGPCAQHTASELPNGNILLYDNGAATFFQDLCVGPDDPWGPAVERPITRITEYALDEAAGTATLVRDLAPPNRFGFFAGGTTQLGNGSTLVGWAVTRQSVATEIDPSGQVVWELKVHPDVAQPDVTYSTYRAYKFAVPDVIRPVVRIERPAEGATYARGAKVALDHTCTDRGGSSLHGCTVTGLVDGALDTTSAGTHTVRVSAVDGSGNTRTVSRTYTVAPDEYLPDVMIRRLGSSVWVGADISGTDQAQTTTARATGALRRVSATSGASSSSAQAKPRSTRSGFSQL